MQNKFQKMFSSQAGIIFCRLALSYCGAAGVANYYFSGSSLVRQSFWTVVACAFGYLALQKSALLLHHAFCVGKAFFKSPFKVTALLFSALLSCLFRNNAIYVFLVAALVFLLFFKGCRLRLTAVLAGALAAFLLLKPFNGFLAFGCCIAGAGVLYLKGRFCESCERAH